MTKVSEVLKRVIRTIKRWLGIKEIEPDYLPKTGIRIPTEVIKQFEEKLGSKVEPEKIVLFPSDGYKHYAHGEFDLYVFRREGTLYYVRKFFDGEFECN